MFRMPTLSNMIIINNHLHLVPINILFLISQACNKSKQHQIQYQNQIINMLSELERIKAKDYQELDERLFNNISKTGELDDTITKLVELQHYLRSQIQNIQDDEQKQAALKASKIVLADVSYYNNGEKCGCWSKFREVLEETGRMKKYLKKCLQYIGKQHLLFLEDSKEMTQDACEQLISKYLRKCNETNKLKQQMKRLRQKNEEIIKENEKLKQDMAGISENRFKTAEKQMLFDREYIDTIQTQDQEYTKKSERHNFSHTYTKSNLQICKAQENCQSISHFFSTSHPTQNNTPRLPMPLRKPSLSRQPFGQSCEKMNIQQNLYRTQSIKDMRQYNSNYDKKYSTNDFGKDLREYGNRLQRSQTPVKNRPQPIIMQGDKENVMLKKKGVEIKEQRRSVKKLKVFSHF